MSTRPTSAILFGRTRASVLGLLYGRTDQQFYLRQIARKVGTSAGAVQRELEQLVAAGLVVRSSRENQILYQANPRSPIFQEIRSLVAKTVGIFDVLRSALAPLASTLEVAFVYGSVARQEETAESDVDLMIVGAITLDEVLAQMAEAQSTLGREINPTVYSPQEFKTKLAGGNHFVSSVLEGDKLFLIGGEDELRNLAPKRVAQKAGHQSRRNQTATANRRA